MLCLTLAASMGGGTRWEPYWGWRYAPCCAVPAVSTPSANGAGIRSWRLLRHWGSPGTPLPASPPCNRCSAGVQPVGPGCFQIRLGQWLKYQGLEEGEALAIDGKRLRGIHGEQLPGMHLVAAYAHQPGILVGQQAVRAKRNELDAVPGLLEQLELRGRVVTAAAQFTQRRVCQHIVSQGALFLCHKGQSACLEAGHRRYLVRYPGG